MHCIYKENVKNFDTFDFLGSKKNNPHFSVCPEPPLPCARISTFSFTSVSSNEAQRKTKVVMCPRDPWQKRIPMAMIQKISLLLSLSLSVSASP